MTGAAASGVFAVAASSAEAAAFRAATGAADAGDRLPLTFSMRWLAQPEVRAALLAAVPEADLLPVHESQSFEVSRDLRVGQPYVLKLAARREADPARLIVEGVVEDADGIACVRLETVLRLVPMRAA